MTDTNPVKDPMTHAPLQNAREVLGALEVTRFIIKLPTTLLNEPSEVYPRLTQTTKLARNIFEEMKKAGLNPLWGIEGSPISEFIGFEVDVFPGVPKAKEKLVDMLSEQRAEKGSIAQESMGKRVIYDDGTPSREYEEQQEPVLVKETVSGASTSEGEGATASSHQPVNEKALEAFMLAYHEYGGTGLGFRKCLEAYEAAKSANQPVKVSVDDISTEHALHLLRRAVGIIERGKCWHEDNVAKEKVVSESYELFQRDLKTKGVRLDYEE